MSASDYNRQPVEVLELRQPRCDRRFGVGEREPNQVPDLIKSDGDTILSTEVDRSSSIMAVFDVTFPASPDGVIWEQGGSGTGSYLGVTSGNLTWRAGDGSSATGTAETALVRTDVSPLAGKTVRLIAEVIMPNTVRVSAIDGDGKFVLDVSASAAAGSFPGGTWAGGNDGGVGTVGGGGSVVGEDATNFNGSIGLAKFYEGEFPLTGCNATGTPLCYQTFATCKARPQYRGDGEIRWRFCHPGDNLPRLHETVDADHIHTNALPILKRASTKPTRINVGASRKGESPFGLRFEIDADLSDMPWDDRVEDFYLDDPLRNRGDASFWSKWVARLGEGAAGITAYLYRGYAGQALTAMQVSRADVQKVDGPNNGSVSVSSKDPLSRADRLKAKFPRATGVRLLSDIDATQTDIKVFALEKDLSDSFGNTATSYVRFGSEVIGYTGYTSAGTDEWTLTGVTRAQRGTAAEEHEVDDGGQRCGAYDNIAMYKVAEDLIKNHTTVPDALINDAVWTDEGGKFLSSLKTTATITDPEPVEELIGELSRDSIFSIWWDDRDQTIPLLPVRPPQETPVVWTDRINVIEDSVSSERKPDDRITRVSLFYGQRDPTEDQEDVNNYANRRILIESDTENENYADGTVRDLAIYSRWIRTDGNALFVSSTLAQRFKVSPRYLTVEVDAKDRSVGVGDVVDLTTYHISDAEGNSLQRRWQVIEIEEVQHGEKMRSVLQSYQFDGRFAFIMADGSPDYIDATEAQRADGCWIADETGRMPNGDPPYLIQ